MADDGKGLLGRLFEQGARMAATAAEQVLSDPRGQEAMARAIGAAQRAKQRLEALQAAAMRAAGIPGRQEYQDLVKQLARIKRKARELAEQVDAQRPGAAGGEGGGGAAGDREGRGSGRSR
jgi:hypothetical protein